MRDYVVLSKYVLRFTLVYYVLLGLVMFYNDTVGIQYVEQNIMPPIEYMVFVIVMEIVALLLPILIAMYKFIKNNNRVPNKSEKIKFIVMSYVLIQFASVPYLYIYRGYVGEIFDFSSCFELPIGWAIAMICLQLSIHSFTVFMMFLFCGWSSKFLIKKTVQLKT